MKRHFILTMAIVGALVCEPRSLRAQPSQRLLSAADPFRQLDEILPSPNDQRTASGAPGHGYWQQRVDYVIDVELDDDRHTLTGSERITYFNRSPDTLRYLWVQLDANIYAPDSDAVLTATAPSLDRLSFGALERLLARRVFDGSVKITAVRGAEHQPLKHRIVKTMMRIDLPRPLRPGKSTVVEIDWHYQINDSRVVPGRTGYEYFERDKNCIYEIAIG